MEEKLLFARVRGGGEHSRSGRQRLSAAAGDGPFRSGHRRLSAVVSHASVINLGTARNHCKALSSLWRGGLVNTGGS